MAGFVDCPKLIHCPKVNGTITIGATKLLGLLILLASISASSPGALDLRSSKRPAEFGACYVHAQDRDGRAWAFMPTKHGGTFTDSGAYRTRASYWLNVRSTGPSTRLRLSDAAPSPVIKAVEQCR